MGDMFGAHYNLGRYYQQKRDWKNADFHLNRALKVAVNESEKKLANHRLEELKDAEKNKKPGNG